MTKFWELEEVHEEKPLSPEDRFCERLYKETTYRDDTGRFVVALPFKPEFPKSLILGHSRNIALAQFLRNEAKLLKTPQSKNDYDKVITEYLTL